jgi:hypothetical protein
MFDLPVDIIRHIIKIMIENEPLSLFTIDNEILEICEYTKEEKVTLINFAIYENYKFCRVPFFDMIFTKKRKFSFFTRLILDNMKDLIINEDNLEMYFGKNIDLYKYFIYFIKECNFKLVEFMFTQNETLLKKKIIDEKSDIRLDSSCCEYAIENNSLYTLCFLRENGFCLSKYCSQLAVKNNNFKILENLLTCYTKSCPYFYSKSCPFKEHKCEFSEFTYSQAVSDNNLEMLKILCENKNYSFKIESNCCTKAILNNNLEILKILRNNNPPFSWDNGWCYVYALKNGNLEILNYINSQNIKCRWNKNYLSHVNETQCLEVLKNVFKNNPSPETFKCLYSSAITEERMEILTFIDAQNITDPFCKFKIKNHLKELKKCKNKEILEWVDSHDNLIFN